jgi:hypothetical protein
MLKDLKSSLKNLKFGNDTRGGGSSGLPYIKPGLPEDSPAGEYLAGIARTSADFPLRGGTYSTIASTEDTIRISRFLNDFPKGSIFTSKQVGLQKSNPLIETGKLGRRLNTQTYNLNANLLAQVTEQGTGVHINRAGFNTNELIDPQNKYEYIVSNKSENENRLVTLFNTKIASSSYLGPEIDLSQLGISSKETELFDYSGGPGSLFGDGNTLIFRTTNTTNAPKGQIRLEQIINTNALLGFSSGSYKVENTEYQQGYGLTAVDFIRAEETPIGVSPINKFNNTMGYSKLLESKVFTEFTEFQDFRSKTNASTLAKTVDYNTFKIENRIGVGSPGARPNNLRDSFYDEFKEGQDKINRSPIYRRTIDKPVEDDSPEVRDLIKFCIEAIDNGNLDMSNRMHFRAYITNFSDNIGAEWNAQKYMGRGENFYTYQGFTREVGFTFIVAAQSVQEMEKIYQKINYLASTLHPDYSTQGFMRGTIHKLTIGEYFYRTPGVITSMNISVDDNYPWEIKMTQPELRKQNNGDVGASGDQLQMEVPQILKIQMNFKPIMDKLPQRGLKEPIIISEKVANNYLARKDFEFSL